MRFTEREPELTQLTAALDRAGRGSGTAVLVSGEAGVGKSSLIAAFRDRIGARARAFKGTCEDLLTPRPLGPFRDMARGAAGRLDVDALVDRDTLIDVLLTEMSFLQRPAVLIVEDVQWADQGSLDVLRFLVRRVAELPAMLLLSFRDSDLRDDHPLLRVAAAAPPDSVLRLPLAGLSDAAVALLAAEAGVDPGPVIATVAGNPFYLSEVLAAPSSYVPTSIRHAVMARVATLPPECQDAVGRLSVLPAEVDWGLLGLLLDDPSVLDPAEAMGLLVPSYGGTHFRHELARRAVAESLSTSRRQSAHREILDALVALNAEPSRLVHHAAALNDADTVARYADLAAREAAKVHGHREVVRFAELALGHALSAVRRAQLHSLASAGHYGINQFSSAAAHADRAVETLAECAPKTLEHGEALLVAARMHTLLADPAGARTRALEAVAVLEGIAPSRALAFGYSILGSQDAVQARFSEALSWTERALRLAEETGAAEVVAHALTYRGVARASLGDDEGIADLQRAIEVAGRTRHADFETVASHNLASVLLRVGRVAEAEPYLEHAERVAREYNLDVALFRIEAQLCLCLLLRGEWDEAERRLRDLLAGGADPGANAVNPLSFLGRILARRGDPEAATLVERAWRLAVATGEDQKISVAGGARIEWLWLTGDAATVRAEGEELLRVVLRAAPSLDPGGGAPLPAPGRCRRRALPGLPAGIRRRDDGAVGDGGTALGGGRQPLRTRARTQRVGRSRRGAGGARAAGPARRDGDRRGAAPTAAARRSCRRAARTSDRHPCRP